ncbi:MAG: cardiolipin synthase [Mesorhizobium sp.]|uniref:phospholipase D-like domain-containing protein n=1 Tax=Mesorhizobium sp. TaxID=1871066 RepID=UPI0011FEBABC|nr:phospholipase D-like domain-containing protein [Mesorhizobium sp.]TIT17719.1 MAG: cardiolipin synthase [Mesorhizobium sp.]
MPKTNGLIVQPDDGNAPVIGLINGATRSLYIKQFSFTDPAIQQAAIARAKDGVDVRVMLNPQRSSGSRANDEAFALFEASGVHIRWANPRFAVTHEKSIVVDEELALIATFNLCDKYFTQTRDYGVIVHEPIQVAQIVEGFHADWEQKAWYPAADTRLLWSNSNARQLMSDFIDSAKDTLDVQHPKFVDATVTERIAAAAKRGVHVRVLCGGKHGISDWDILDTFSSLRLLQYLDVKVHKQKNLRLHAKLILVDGKHALVGSMNIDRSAFDLRRELGVIVADRQIVDGLSRVFQSDWLLSGKYEPPLPLSAFHHLEDDFPHDPELGHE